MKICMIVYNLEKFGGLEEIVTTLAIGLQQRGHQLSVLSTGWMPHDNQYIRSLHEQQILFVQLPKWLSYPASHWPTKEKILAIVLQLCNPLIYVLGALLFLWQRGSWGQALASAQNWLRGQLMSRVIGPDRRKPLIRLLLRWWQFRWQPDVLHLHGFHSHAHSLLFVIDWAHSNGQPVVYEEHQTPDRQFDQWQGFQQSVNQAAVVVAVSEKSAHALRTVCGITQPIVVANPIVVGPTILNGQENVGSNPQHNPIQVTTVARLYVMKGLTYLLDAIWQIKQIHPTAQFKVYGDGPLHQELLAYASQLGLDGNKIFVGAFTRKELPKIMAQTDIFVLPSILEGLPLSIVEAMAYGRAIVATAVGGIPELIEDGVNGLLCKPSDATGLTEKIQKLIEEPALRARLSYAARKAYEQGPFQPASVCDHFITIYQEALDKECFKKAPMNNRLDSQSRGFQIK